MTAAYPLEWPKGWPRTTVPQHCSVYRQTFDRILERFYREMELARASSVVISSWLSLRLDGKPRTDSARMKLPDPGVAVYFMRKKHQFVIANDRFDTVAANLWSITLAIEGLRQLERHGGQHLMERAFSGFQALPPPPDSAPTSRPWREVLGLGGLDCNIPAVALAGAEAAYRTLAKKAHPDAGGSEHAMFDLNRAIAEARKEFS